MKQQEQIMNTRILTAVFLVFSSCIIANAQISGLSFDYYDKSCPKLEQIVREFMTSITKTDPSISAAILRLVFHDCQVGGCDGSVLLNIKDPKHEQEFDSTKNFGIRNRDLIDKLKANLDFVCPSTVSCADLLVLAARDSVAIAGGPNIKVPFGRKDTKIPHTRKEADVGLPRNNVNLTKAIQVFATENGINFEEVIAILGAHTLGKTHCDGIMDRLYDNVTVPLPENEAKYVQYLKKTCPKGGSNQFTTTFELDPTPNTFDNKYYVNALNGHGLIGLDAEFARDPKSRVIVEKFAKDQKAFFDVFSSAFAKITSLGVLTGKNGGVRKTCSVLNS